MKLVHLLKNNESIEMLASIYSVDKSNITIKDDKICGYKYATIKDGSDFIVIKNYDKKILYTVKKDDTLIDFLSNNFEIIGNSELVEGDNIILKTASSNKHKVKPSETLNIISNNYNISIQNIIEKNNLKTDKVYVGQILKI